MISRDQHEIEHGSIDQLERSGTVGQNQRVRSTVQNLRVVFRCIQEHSRWVERQCGVSAAQLWAMWEVDARPGMRVSELSEALSIHQSTTSNLLDKLEKKRLIQRQRKGPDHRVVHLYLTEEGKHLVKGAPGPAQGALTKALYELSERQLADLDDGIAQLVIAMNPRDSQAALHPLSDS